MSYSKLPMLHFQSAKVQCSTESNTYRSARNNFHAFTPLNLSYMFKVAQRCAIETQIKK